MSDPLDPLVIAEVRTRLRQVDRMMTPSQAARRLYVIADTLVDAIGHGDKAPRELFLLALAVAAHGAAECAKPIHDGAGMPDASAKAVPARRALS